MTSAGLKIGELATRLKIPVETIRYYEREHLLPQARRTEGNYRLYDPAQVERLAFIRNCRAFDMTLDEVRKLLQLRDAPEQECGGVNQLLDEHIGHVGERLAELHRLKDELRQLRGTAANPVAGARNALVTVGRRGLILSAA
ncbi:MAG: pbrR [Hydrocarboniphaga sp.]|uniref:Cd(II)/Pb(II)-responsive transcriptional regulator n=1 Tax=Hydrocarboniphaga sp. TaxID=2033016 RepID=UPI002637AC94|nr:Cd(II)/Pb(II)-responsive transcriptional regulator [Hydrocarboniphaga sp.]MDB5968896.1 pbrR [Hydrocarboniphaga sp.]